MFFRILKLDLKKKKIMNEMNGDIFATINNNNNNTFSVTLVIKKA